MSFNLFVLTTNFLYLRPYWCYTNYLHFIPLGWKQPKGWKQKS